MIDAKHDNIYFGLFEKNAGKYTKLQDFSFDNIESILSNLNISKKKIFFVGNCGILYKDVIQSYLKKDIYFLEDSLASSKYVGIAAFDKYKEGKALNSLELSALYLKKSNAEEMQNGN